MRLPLLLVLSATLTACATRPTATPVAEADVERLTLSVNGRTLLDARVDGTTLNGVAHGLTHFDDGYRGRSRRGFVFVSEHTPGRISGVIGNGAITTVDYDAEPVTGHIRAHGRWAATYFAVEIDRNVISVSDKFCTDTYRRLDETSDVFVATLGCWSNTFYQVRMHVPDAFFRRPVGEQVVFLTAFLS
jgi:hypothetical protein